MNAIILAGGKNERMAKEKAFLKLEGKSIIEIVIEKVQPLFEEVIVVTNFPKKYKHLKASPVRSNPSPSGSDAPPTVGTSNGVRIVKDTIPHCGPLGGLYSGLKESKSHYNFVTGCDMPFLKILLIKHLIDNCRGNDITIPKFDGFLEPLCAIYSKNCLKAIKEELNKNNLTIRSFFNKVRVKYIPKKDLLRFDLDLISFFNINTPKDIAKAEKLFKGK